MNSDNNTLVILTPGWASSEADTNCLPMQQSLVKCLKEKDPGLNIIILSFQYPYHIETYSWYGITVTSFNGRNKGGLARLLLRRKIISRLKEINNKNKITGILSFWLGECAAVGKKFAGANNISYYCWLLGQDARKENKYPHRIKPRAAELIALSDFVQDEFEKNHGIRPQHIVPAGVEVKQFHGSSVKKDIDLLAVGSLIPLKQYDVFIEVVAGIKKELPGIKAMLIGDGPEKEHLQSLILQSGLADNIILTGELPHPELLLQMQRAKIFLHPSSYEGFGVVCIEALAAGCHTISFCKPMKQEITQWHIVQNKKEMARKALDILQNKETVYTPVVPFAIEETVSKMMKLFTTGRV